MGRVWPRPKHRGGPLNFIVRHRLKEGVQVRLISAILFSCVLATVGKAFAETFAFELFVHEAAGPRLLSKGERKYAISDTLVTRQSGGGREYLHKQLPLGNGFVVGVSDHGDPELSGFGCWLRRQPSPMEVDAYPGFSWEWFNRSDGNVFEKLQGGGRIRVTTKTIGGGQFIERIEFLEDIVFRMNGDRSGKPGVDTHNMTIRKGSVLAFPPQAPPRDAKTTLHNLTRRSDA